MSKELNQNLLLGIASLVIFSLGMLLQKVLASNTVSYSWLVTLTFMVALGYIADKLIGYKTRSHHSLAKKGDNENKHT